MMDTLNNPQYGSAAVNSNDAELLRQQEAFINQNRMHIEKRRHERSPEREHSYSPPPIRRRAYSRERDVARKPSAFNRDDNLGGGGGRGRRAGSRDGHFSKRRRSNSTDRDGGGNGARNMDDDKKMVSANEEGGDAKNN